MRILTSLITLLTGAGIIWFTSYTQNMIQTPPLFTSFYFLGALFLAYPVYQATKWYITKEDNDAKDPDSIRMKRCPHCDTPHYNESNYCHMCGAKL